MKINPHNFYEGSFADEKVIDVTYISKSKYLSFFVRNIETEQKGITICHKSIKFTIQDWLEVKVFNLDKDTHEKIEVGLDEIDFLDEILIYVPSKAQLILEGFGKKSHLWKKIIFTSPNVIIEAEE